MPSPFARAQMMAALQHTDFDVQAAFEYIKATGKATETLTALEKRIENIVQELLDVQKRIDDINVKLRDPELKNEAFDLMGDLGDAESRKRQLEIERSILGTDYAKVLKDRVDRKIEKAEAKQRFLVSAMKAGIIDLTYDEDIEMPEARPVSDNNDDDDDNPVANQVLYIVKQNLGTRSEEEQQADRQNFMPFWYNKRLDDLQTSPPLGSLWAPVYDLVNPRSSGSATVLYQLDELLDQEPRLRLTQQTDRSNFPDVFDAFANYLHGVLIGTRILQGARNINLMQINHRKRFLFNQTLDQGLLQVVAAKIPGAYVMLPTGEKMLYKADRKNRVDNDIVSGGQIIVTLVDFTTYRFAFGMNESGDPEFYMVTAGKNRRAADYLTEATYDNVMAILQAYIDYSNRRLEQIGILNQVSKTVRGDRGSYAFVIPKPKPDTAHYIDPAEFEGNQIELLDRKYRAMSLARERVLQRKIADGEVTRGMDVAERNQGKKDGKRAVWYEFYQVVSDGEMTNGRGELAVHPYEYPAQSAVNRRVPAQRFLRTDKIVFLESWYVVQPGDVDFPGYYY